MNTLIHFVNIRGWPLERYHGNFLHKSIWVSHHFDFCAVCHNICPKMTTPSNIATVQHWWKVFQIWHRYCSCYGVSGWRIWFSAVRKCVLVSWKYVMLLTSACALQCRPPWECRRTVREPSCQEAPLPLIPQPRPSPPSRSWSDHRVLTSTRYLLRSAWPRPAETRLG